MKNFYTVNEFVDITGKTISAPTVYKYIRDNKIPVKIIGSKILIVGSFVDKLVNNPDFCVPKEK